MFVFGEREWRQILGVDNLANLANKRTEKFIVVTEEKRERNADKEVIFWNIDNWILKIYFYIQIKY